jgi:hypothetical protein
VRIDLDAVDFTIRITGDWKVTDLTVHERRRSQDDAEERGDGVDSTFLVHCFGFVGVKAECSRATVGASKERSVFFVFMLVVGKKRLIAWGNLPHLPAAHEMRKNFFQSD